MTMTTDAEIPWCAARNTRLRVTSWTCRDSSSCSPTMAWSHLDVPGADFWYVEHGTIREFNCYVSVDSLLELMGIQPDSVSVIKGQAFTRPLPSTVFGGAHDRATEPHHRPRSRPRGLGEVHGGGLRPTRAPTVRPLPGRANRKRRQPGLLPGSRPDQPTALRVPGLGSGIRRDLRPGEGAWPTLLGRSEEDPPRRDQSQRWRARGLLPRSLRARPRDHNPALRVGRVERVEPNN